VGKRESATVDFFNKEKGFGFLRNWDGEDWYLHIKDIEGNRAPTKADIIEFTPSEGEKGPIAKNAKIID